MAASLLHEAPLVDAHTERMQQETHALRHLQPEFTQQLFHTLVDDLLGHAHSYDPFLSSSSPSAPSPSALHGCVRSLRAWIAHLLSDVPGLGAGTKQEGAAAAEVATALRERVQRLELGEEVSKQLHAALLARLPELVSHARTQSVRELSEWSVRDFDWSARVTLASSSLANLRTPVLSLSLLLTPPAGSGASEAAASKTRTVQLEMDAKGLDNVLAQMERIAAVVDQYSMA